MLAAVFSADKLTPGTMQATKSASMSRGAAATSRRATSIGQGISKNRRLTHPFRDRPSGIGPLLLLSSYVSATLVQGHLRDRA